MATEADPAADRPGFAPAKINLALHVMRKRLDGYHLLDSIVVFAGIGDQVDASAAPVLSLHLTGPMAVGVPGDAGNLVWRAAQLLAPARTARLTLAKHLPLASGIGGGSSDAAAALRVLSGLWQCPLPLPGAVVALGADVPVCLERKPARMEGIGERLSDLPALPGGWLVLANPGGAVPTTEIFRRLARHDAAPLPARLPQWPDIGAFAAWLGGQRNDLQAAAIGLHPPIAEALAALAALPACLLARMSGSGATCFGLFPDRTTARLAAATLGAGHPGWWCKAAPILR